MASTVAEPLERRLATIAGVTELTSQNFVGSSMVVVQFALNRDINGAARDVKRRSRRRAPTCRPRCAAIRPIASTTRPIRRSSSCR
jgi:multidrug efflux pump subunit AcrB